MPLPVAAVNALTARWAATIDGGSTVLSGLGLWPLLALLRLGADDVVGAELDGAIGDADPAAAADLLGTLREAAAIEAALGLWSEAGMKLEPAWLEQMPAGTHGRLRGEHDADRRALDDWARENTAGLIDRMPVGSLEGVRLLLASAIAVRTRWEHPFIESAWTPAEGPWTGRSLTRLRASGRDLDEVVVADTDAGPLTVIRCPGRDDIEVRLVLGAPDASAGAVLAAAITADGVPGSRLPDGTPGPGLQIGDQASIDRPQLVVLTPKFRVTGSHDLTANSDLFGLTTAIDSSTGHFPGISPEDLYVGGARQDALALFTAEGFEAAAVSTIAMAGTSMRQPNPQAYRQITATIDRPFGFLAVHRPTGLILVAGWVDEPV